MAPPPVPTLKPKSAHVPVSEQGSDAPTPTPRGSQGSMDVDQARVFGLKLIVSLSRSNTGYMWILIPKAIFYLITGLYI